MQHTAQLLYTFRLAACSPYYHAQCSSYPFLDITSGRLLFLVSTHVTLTV